MNICTPELQGGMAQHESTHAAAEVEGELMQHIEDASNILGDEGHFPEADSSDDDGGASPALNDALTQPQSLCQVQNA